MSLKFRIIVNAISNWANMFVTAVAGLVVVPVILSQLGTSAYGVWALLAYGLAFPALLEISFGLAMSRFAAFYRNEPDKLNAFVTVSFFILAFFGIVVIIIAIICSFFISNWFEAIPKEYAHAAQITCILVGVTFGLQMLQSTHAGVLRGFEYYTLSNAVLMFSSILRAILIVVFLVFWKTIIAIQVAYIITTILSALAMYYVAKHSIPILKFNMKGINKEIVWELYRYTYHSIARSGSTIAMFNILTLLIGWKGTAADVTAYDIASKLPNVIRSLLGGVQSVFLPVVTNLKATGQIQMVRSVVKKTTQMCFVLSMIVAVLLISLGEPLLHFWLRREVSVNMIIVMNLLVLSMLPDGFFGLWLPVLVGLGDLKWLTGMSILGAALAVILAFVLIQKSLMIAPIAVAVSLLIVLWLYRGIWLPLYGIRQLNITAIEYFKDSMFKPLIALIISIIIVYILHNFLKSNNISFFIRSGVAGFLVSSIFALIVLPQEVKSVFNLVKNIKIFQKGL
jgi:O-antigen/teichoic acid export membrane protein